jgi:hypothetical protein
MRCEFCVFENEQSDNVGDNKTPSDAEVADAQEDISKLDSAASAGQVRRWGSAYSNKRSNGTR